MVKIQLDGKPFKKWIRVEKNRDKVVSWLGAISLATLATLLALIDFNFAANWSAFVNANLASISKGEIAIMAEIVIIGFAFVILSLFNSAAAFLRDD